MAGTDPLLQLENVDIAIEDAGIVSDLDMHVNEGEAVGLIGRNGAGKTTTFRGIMGQTNVTAGSIRFRESELTELPPDKRSELGIGYQPEDRDLFIGMTVDENFRMPIWVAELNDQPVDEETRVTELYELFADLKDLKDLNVENLSGGQAKMTSIGRALALEPDLLLLDEPLEGLAPTIVEDIKDIVQEINDQGIAVLLAEANLAHATDLVDRAYILERGEIYDEGEIDQLIEKKDVQNLLQG